MRFPKLALFIALLSPALLTPAYARAGASAEAEGSVVALAAVFGVATAAADFTAAASI